MALKKDPLYWADPRQCQKCSTKGDAIAWGRIAAVLGWGLTRMSEEVEPEFRSVARAAYQSRLLKLHGAPF